MSTEPEITHDIIPGITTVGVPREKVEAIAADLRVDGHSVRPDLADLRKRAAQHAGTGNYWAGKCVGLIDQLGAFDGRCLVPECGAAGVGQVTLFGRQVGSACEPHLHAIARMLSAFAAPDPQENTE